jgi:hypothetical protein
VANAAFGSGDIGSTRSAMIETLRLTWITSISTRSSTVWWRTRRIGRIRHFIGAPPAGYILPGGSAATKSCSRRGSGAERSGGMRSAFPPCLYWTSPKARASACRAGLAIATAPASNRLGRGGKPRLTVPLGAGDRHSGDLRCPRRHPARHQAARQDAGFRVSLRQLPTPGASPPFGEGSTSGIVGLVRVM